MNKLQTYLPFHFLICLIVGICTQFYLQIWQFGLQNLFLIGVLLLVFLFVFNKPAKKKLFTLCSLVLFFIIGLSSIYIKNSNNFDTHFTHHLAKNTTTTLRISKVLKHSNFYNKYQAEVTETNNTKTTGKILLNIKKDSLQKQLKTGNLLLTTSDFKEVELPKNPHQFNYKNYLAKQGIHHQLFIKKDNYKIIDVQQFSIIGLSEKIRTQIQQSLKKYNFSKDEFAVINALLLGNRNEISKELRENYTNAGAIHILAISGLHIGIIFILLSHLLKPLCYIKNGKLITSFLIVLLLWLFAIIAGLSASVVRAVTMFTFVAIGQSLQRKQPVEHSLIASMFVLLLVKPMFLFDVGFQLSYLAVFGIVWMQPLFAQLWKPKLKIIYKAWQIITVSISAQIAVLPISLYYFHQFPSLFLLSNIVIIPVLSSILFGGIAIVILSMLNILPLFLADFYGWIISLMNQFVGWISHQEAFLFQQISMSFLAMLAWYIVLIVGYQLIIHQKTKHFLYFLSSVVVLQSVYLFEKHQQETKQEFIIFHKSRTSMLGQRHGNTLHLFTDSYQHPKKRIMNSYIVNEGISIEVDSTSRNIYTFKKETVLVIDSLGVYDVPIKNAVVVLQQSPKINLARMIQKLQPKQIIADGSNYKSYILRWQETCKQQKTPFYYTGQNGAYVLFN